MANSLWRYFHLLNSRTDPKHLGRTWRKWWWNLTGWITFSLPLWWIRFSRNGSLSNCRPKRWRFAGLSLSWKPSSGGYFCNSFNLLQLVTKPTRTTNTSKTLIDVALTTEFYHQLRCKYLGSCWSLFGGGHTKAKSPEASAFLYCYQKLQNLQSWVISDRFGVRSFPHCKYFGRF